MIWFALVLQNSSSTRAPLHFCSTCLRVCFCLMSTRLPRYHPPRPCWCLSMDCSIIARQWWPSYWCSFCHHWLTGNILEDVSLEWTCVSVVRAKLSAVVYLLLLLSFFFAGWVISPALRPYMIGPMRNPDIQNLLEAFASLKRGLQCNKARSSYSR